MSKEIDIEEIRKIATQQEDVCKTICAHIYGDACQEGRPLNHAEVNSIIYCHGMLACLVSRLKEALGDRQR
jgi:hypothetical protein